MFNKTKIQNLGRTFISAFLVVQIFLGFVGQITVAQAAITDGPLNSNSSVTSSINVPEYKGVEDSIRQYLCAPSEDKDKESLGTALFDCVTKVYKFGIAFGAIALVFFVVLAGYFYITGGEQGKGKGKTIFTTALTGMAVILTSYVLLSFINPDLVKIKTIQTPIFDAADLPTCEEVGYQGNCVLPSGQIQVGNNGGGSTLPGGQGGCFAKEQGGCTRANISACPGMAKNMDLALRICNQESAGGNYTVMSGTDTCTEVSTNSVVSFSGGLWQINIENSAGDFPECSGVLKHVSPGSYCRVYPPYKPAGSQCKCQFGPKGRSGYDACVAALKNPVKNTQAGCGLFNTRSTAGTEPGIRGWQPWSTSYNKCKNSNQ